MLFHSSNRNNNITVATNNHSIAELSSIIPIEGIPGKVFYFHRIKTRPEYEGIGEGRELMIEVCKHVDQENATIYINLNPYGKRDLKSLKSFFKASDFEMLQEPNVMIRRPRDTTGEQPYLIKEKIIKERNYNINYGDGRICECGHPYHRHFDSYDKMRSCGCKYCSCYIFIEKKGKDTNEDTNEHTL